MAAQIEEKCWCNKEILYYTIISYVAILYFIFTTLRMVKAETYQINMCKYEYKVDMGVLFFGIKQNVMYSL